MATTITGTTIDTGRVDTDLIKSKTNTPLSFQLSDGTAVGNFSNTTGALISNFGLAVGGTGAVNTLDDYEEGTWTPTIVGTTSAGTGTYGQQNGSYTKVGRQVSFQLFITLSAHTGTGFIQINGLPFNSLAAPNYHTVYYRIETIAMTAGNYIQGYIIAGDAKIALEQVPTGGGGAGSIPIDPAMSIIVSGTYAT